MNFVHRTSLLVGLGLSFTALATASVGCGDDTSDTSSSTSSSGGGSTTSSTSSNGGGGGTGGTGGGGTGGYGGGLPSGNFDCAAPSGSLPSLTVTEVANAADGLIAPAHFTFDPGDPNRNFITDLSGSIFVMENGDVLETPFLEIDVSFSGEQGLLGVAFHPDYADNGRFFVHYSEPGTGDTIIEEYARATDVTANPEPVREILTVEQPFGNHNGGSIEFGPDGHLYIFLGDGGSGGDPLNAGQDLTTLLGKVLRIDVDGTAPYTIPAGNLPGGAPEIWDYGLRNPWRSTFDGCTGDLYIADVGQNAWEEVNFEPAGQGNKNYGWRTMEGSQCFNPSSGCDQTGLTLPVFEYQHQGGGRSITGGYVYRGSDIPAARGRYFFADYVTRQIWSFRQSGGTATDVIEHTSELGSLQATSFGQDAFGEVYVVTVGPARVLKIVPQ
jgi:glucose/arabinose dehydrogenase